MIRFPPTSGTPLLSLLILLVLAACARGEPAPDFQVSLYSGGDFRLSQVAQDQALVVNFWYPSCPPCRDELPHFEQAWRQYEDRGVRFLGVFVPQGFDTEEDARNFISELGLTFDFATDQSASIAQEYGIEFFPTTYFISRGGRVHSVEISNLDSATITEIVADLVGG